jgi:hypothetical protein
VASNTPEASFPQPQDDERRPIASLSLSTFHHGRQNKLSPITGSMHETRGTLLTSTGPLLDIMTGLISPVEHAMKSNNLRLSSIHLQSCRPSVVPAISAALSANRSSRNINLFSNYSIYISPLIFYARTLSDCRERAATHTQSMLKWEAYTVAETWEYNEG